MEKVSSEIDILLLNASEREDTHGTTINIHQSYGIVQTGAGASATFHHGLGPDEREMMLAALSSLTEALGRTQELSVEAKKEIGDLAEETRHELVETFAKRLEGPIRTRRARYVDSDGGEPPTCI